MKNLALLTVVVAIFLFNIRGTVSAQTIRRDIAKEEVNRTLVVEFYNTFFNLHQVDEAAKVVAENYKQHNPTVPDGKEPFVSYFRNFFKQTPGSKARIVRSAVEGDIVWLHVHSQNDDKDRGEAVLDIFRVKDGKIVEHWDIIQTIPETSENNNTMF